jgi:hypothetical protein
MSAHSSSAFSWTSTKIDAAINASLQLQGREGRSVLDVNIIKAVSKLNATNFISL